MAKPPTKATRASLGAWIAQVELTIESIEEQIDDATGAKADALETRLEVWQELLDAMEAAASDLED